MFSVQRLRQQAANDPVRLAICIGAWVCLIPFGYLFAGIFHISHTMRPFFAAFVCIVIVVLANRSIPVFWRVVRSSVKPTFFFLHYAADRTVSVSHVEAMMSAGNYDGAAAEIDTLLAQHGVEANVCRVGLDLHLGKFGSRERAEALLRRMRHDNPAQYERMATQRLIDIYMQHRDTHGKALTELRRLAARFPGTPDAAGALLAIEQLKQPVPAEPSAA